jgi:hypothetical protein
VLAPASARRSVRADGLMTPGLATAGPGMNLAGCRGGASGMVSGMKRERLMAGLPCRRDSDAARPVSVVAGRSRFEAALPKSDRWVTAAHHPVRAMCSSCLDDLGIAWAWRGCAVLRLICPCSSRAGAGPRLLRRPGVAAEGEGPESAALRLASPTGSRGPVIRSPFRAARRRSSRGTAGGLGCADLCGLPGPAAIGERIDLERYYEGTSDTTETLWPRHGRW